MRALSRCQRQKFQKSKFSKLLKSTGFKTEKIDCFRSLKKHEGGIVGEETWMGARARAIVQEDRIGLGWPGLDWTWLHWDTAGLN